MKNAVTIITKHIQIIIAKKHYTLIPNLDGAPEVIFFVFVYVLHATVGRINNVDLSTSHSENLRILFKKVCLKSSKFVQP